MKYTCEITIDLPRDEMVALLDDPQNLKHWQRGLKSYKALSGEPGTEGAQMEIEFRSGKRDIVMIETLIKYNPPHEIHATYDTKGVHNIQKNIFEELDADRSRWISHSEFQFDSFFLKLMGWVIPGAFRKQSQQFMEDFKHFAETGASVAEGS